MTALMPAPAADAPAGRTRTTVSDRLLPLVTWRGGWGVTVVVTVLAGLLRFLRLAIPDNTASGGNIFDEVYYNCDAQSLLRAGVELNTAGVEKNMTDPCTPTGGGSFVVHPPLGKWAIALGIKAFGANPFGWRFAAAVAGTLTVLLLVRAGRRMTGSTLLGGLAGLLLAVDGLHLVQSRIAMLDVFLVFWVVAAFAALLVDRDHLRERLARGASPGARPWRLLAGFCLGAGIATKWSAVYYVVVLGLLSLAWEVGARRSAGAPAPFRATARALPGAMLVYAVVPLAVYVASYTGWFRSSQGFDRDWAQTSGGYAKQDGPFAALLGRFPDGLQSLVHYHQKILEFHEQLSTPHAYQSHPLGWLFLARPVSYYYPTDVGPGRYGCEAASCAREVLAIGNPVLWWGTIPVLLALVWLWVSRRDWRAPALLALIGASILPWIRDDLNERTMFLFYALPAVPFMALSAALVAGWLRGGAHATRRRRLWGTGAVTLYVALAVAALAFFYPLLAAQTLDIDSWRDRIWFSSWI